MARTLYIIVAAALFAFTLACLYGAWYALVGRRIKARKKIRAEMTASAAAKGEGEDAGERRKKKKDSYCYPAINDVMGYEFVKVIDVPAQLLGTKAEQTAEEKASSSKGVGAVTVSVTTVTDESERERAIREIEQGEEGNRIGPIKGEENRMTPPPRKPETPEEKAYETDENGVEPEVAPEDIEDLNRSQEWHTGDWSNRDYDDADIPSDDEFNSMLKAHPEMLAEPSEEELERQRRIADERDRLIRMEEFNRRLERRSDTVDRDIGADIMDQLSGMGGASDEEGEDDGSGNVYIQENDLPEI